MRRMPSLRPRLLAVVLAAACTSLLGIGQADAQTTSTVLVTDVHGVITPVIADHLSDMVERAEASGAHALVVVLDTPGGLITSMRSIVQDFLVAEVPVVVFVGPSGADAGSAGTYITMAAHLAAMAPATTIGAATPVDIQGGTISDKIVNNAAAYAEAIANERGRDVEFARDAVTKGRSITVTEAVEIGAVDFQANDLQDVLDQIDGREVRLASGTLVTIDSQSARIEQVNLSGTRSILQRLADPNLAFVFLSIATLAIIYEIASPGLGAGGVVGVTLLILAMFSLSVLPVNYAGAALMLLAGMLFVLEMFMPGVGVAAASGTVTLILGGLFLFQKPTGIGIDLAVVIPTALLLLTLTIVAGRLAGRTRGQPAMANANALIGRSATASVGPRGVRVRIDGTWWRTSAADDIFDGQPVVVTDIEGLTLDVAPADADATSDPASSGPAAD